MTKKEIRHYIVCNLSYAATSTLIETKLYSQVIENMVNDMTIYYSRKNYHKPIELIIKELNNIKYLGEFIGSAFAWITSNERIEYWAKIQKQYKYYIIRF
jgi:hypothetical protein